LIDGVILIYPSFPVRPVEPPSIVGITPIPVILPPILSIDADVLPPPPAPPVVTPDTSIVPPEVAVPPLTPAHPAVDVIVPHAPNYPIPVLLNATGAPPAVPPA